jgi:hypothetical protein
MKRGHRNHPTHYEHPSRRWARNALRRAHLEAFGGSGVRVYEPVRSTAKSRRRKLRRRGRGGRR